MDSFRPKFPVSPTMYLEHDKKCKGFHVTVKKAGNTYREQCNECSAVLMMWTKKKEKKKNDVFYL